MEVSLNLKPVSFFQWEGVCSHRARFFSTLPDAGSVQMPNNPKVDLAPALLCSAFAEHYPEQPALHHSGATDSKTPDSSVSPKWSQSQSWTEQALHRQEHPVSW